jgi:lysophospholipase L1-like esterase
MPRPAPAGLGAGPWLHPALKKYQVPEADRLPLADEMLRRIDVLARGLAQAHPNVHLVDSFGLAGVTLAEAGTKKKSGDWINEIHLTKPGYAKCARIWEQVLDPLI